MIPAFAVVGWSPTALTLGVAAAYLGIGVGVGAALSRRGLPSTTALSALAVWPLLVGLLQGSGQTVLSAGPYAPRIASALAALAGVAADAGDPSLAPAAEIDRLSEALVRADERLALVDRWLLAERGASHAEGALRQIAALQRARDHAAAEIEAVLDQVAELRLQIGLVTLAGQAVPVREQLVALRSRVAALDEVGAVADGRVG